MHAKSSSMTDFIRGIVWLRRGLLLVFVMIEYWKQIFEFDSLARYFVITFSSNTNQLFGNT